MLTDQISADMKYWVLVILVFSSSFLKAQIPISDLEGNAVIRGKLGVGTDSLERTLTAIGWIRAASDINQNNAIEIIHGGQNGVINVIGNGNLDFRKFGLTRMSMTSNGNFGIGETNPIEKLEVEGAIRLEHSFSETPDQGTIRWNEDTQDFEGYNGDEWLSLTQGCSSTGSMNTGSGPPVDPMCCEQQFAGNSSFGIDVAIDGEYAVIASRLCIVVFEYNGTDWMIMDSLLKDTLTITSGYFPSVDIRGNVIIVGDPSYDGTFNRQGTVYMYEYNGDSWGMKQQLVLDDPETSDGFGSSVAIVNNTIAVGAPGRDVGGNNRQGELYVFDNQGGTWVQAAVLTVNGLDVDDEFGSRIDIASDYIIAGTHLTSKVFFFQKLNNVWGLFQTIENPFFRLGYSVAASDNFAVAGDIQGGDSGFTGRVNVYRNEGGTWISEVLIPSISVNDHF